MASKEDLAKLVVTLEAQNAQYLKKFDQSQKKVARFEKQNRKHLQRVSLDFKKILGGISVVGFVGLTRKIVAATAEQEAAVAQLEQGLATTGNVVGQSLDELIKKAGELQKVTTFGDEEIIRAQSQLVTFARITGDEFDRTIELATDLSTRFGIDLKSSVLQLGKALNDPIANLSALSRAGIQFSAAQKDTIKQLVESNRLLEAQDIILTELEVQFGGSARAARDTFGGAIKGLGAAFGDLLETDGDGLNDAKSSIEELTALLQDPATKAGANAIAAGILNMASAAAEFATTSAGLIQFLSDELAFKFAGPAIDDIVRLDDHVAALNKTVATLEPLALSRPGDRSIAEQLREAQQELEKYSRVLASAQEAAEAKALAPPAVANKPGSPASPPRLPVAPATDTSGLDAALKAEQQYLESIRRRGEAIRDSVLTPNERYAEQLAELNTLLSEGAVTQEIYNRQLAVYQQELNESTGLADLQAQALQIISDQMDPLDRQLQDLADDQSLLNKAMRAGQISAEQYALAIGSIDQEIIDLQSETEKTAESLSTFADQAARNIQDSLGDAIQDLILGTEEWEKQFARSILNIVSQAAAADLASSLGLPGSGDGGNLAGLVKAGSSLFGGFFADGGRPDPNKISIVGERGPELFIPNGVGGEIVPMDQRGGGEQQPVNVTPITVIDPNDIAAAMSAPQMGQVFINHARVNPDAFKRALKIR